MKDHIVKLLLRSGETLQVNARIVCINSQIVSLGDFVIEREVNYIQVRHNHPLTFLDASGIEDFILLELNDDGRFKGVTYLNSTGEGTFQLLFPGKQFLIFKIGLIGNVYDLQKITQ